ncbi:Ltp family lipoprotein [Pseudarthrobacter sp. NamE5]|uniref:Ltp family lipoprotein n=1 Tax=Pseudarthrobacter sp. NamE5 TaxID=2576839 RepID=UPI001F1140C0|nr:Ltp family lipoprotein [Pseudarthrobacter sp. NamE5]
MAFFIIVSSCTGGNRQATTVDPNPTSTAAPTPAETQAQQPAPVETQAQQPTNEATDTATAAQRNALRRAESYLQSQAFSRTGLIKQLEFEQFATEDATWAADHVTVDWKEQAAKKAESYLESQGFSRQRLIDQLIFEGFSPEEAEHGVTAAGL